MRVVCDLRGIKVGVMTLGSSVGRLEGGILGRTYGTVG